MTGLKEILPGIWTWSVFNEEKQINFNGHYIVHAGESVLVDPPEMDEGLLGQFNIVMSQHTECPLKAVLLANGHHDRAGSRFRDRFGVPVLVHESDRDVPEYKVDRTFVDGEQLPAGLRAITIPDQKTPGETGLYLEGDRVLIVGDALIGRVEGKVNLLPPDKYADIERAREGLSVLLDLDFDSLLVGDGYSILKNAKPVVQAFLKGA